MIENRTVTAITALRISILLFKCEDSFIQKCLQPAELLVELQSTSPQTRVYPKGAFQVVCSLERRARRVPYEVKLITPPSKSLGTHSLPHNTHNGDKIEVDGESYIVSSVVLKYKRQGGRYVRNHNGLNVQSLSRFFVTRHLENML